MESFKNANCPLDGGGGFAAQHKQNRGRTEVVVAGE